MASVIVAWRDDVKIGVIALTMPGSVTRATALAMRYAVLADGWLRTPLPTTAWQKVLDQVRPDGTVSMTTALQAFALAYGSLPGVKVPSGSPTRILSGTLAAEWALDYLPHLSRSLQLAIERKLGLSAPGTLAHMTPAPRPHAHVATLGDPNFVPDTTLTDIANHWATVYADPSRLNHTLQYTIVAGVTTTNINAVASTLPVDAAGEGDWSGPYCRIRLSSKYVTPIEAGYVVYAMAHEVFHCFEDELAPGTGNRNKWVIEGLAEWAAQKVDPFYDGSLRLYFAHPRTPEFERTYDAVGFWGHVEDTTGDLWPRIDGILQTQTNDDTYAAAGGATDPFLTSWGTSFFRDGSGGAPWEAFSPTPPQSSATWPTPIDSIVGGSGTVVANATTTAQYELTFKPSEPVVNVEISGSARLDPHYNYTDLRDAWFCITPSACVCPPDTTGTVPATRPLNSKTTLGLSGRQFTGTYGSVRSASLSEFCQPNTPPQQGGGIGGSFGDPYITTFDGSRKGLAGYGFQTTGEYTLVKSTVDNLEIQARLRPFAVKGTFLGDLAMNTAFAMRDGGAVVEVDNTTPGIGQPGSLVLYLDHHRASPTAGQTYRLAGGGSVRYTPSQVTVTWPDGTAVNVYRLLYHFGVNIAVQPSRRRAGRLTGLFGNDDRKTTNDYVGRDGRRYPAKLVQGFDVYTSSLKQRHIVLDEFGASWRITPATSLFVYPPGKNTYSYTVKGFPARAISQQTLNPSQLAAARAACRRAGVTNPALLAGCIVDVGATGNRQLATSAAEFQRATGLRPGPTGGGLSGRWSGRYSGAFNGTFILNWTQSGSILKGRIKLSSPRLALHVAGIVSGGVIRFGAVGIVHYSGSVHGNKMSGTYTSPRGGGSWSATRIS
jgi:hypothetical protein